MVIIIEARMAIYEEKKRLNIGWSTISKFTLLPLTVWW